MTVLIKDSQRSLKTDKKRIKKITGDLLTSLGLDDKDISILFVDNSTIKRLNKGWLGKDRPTNVISFSYINSSPGPSPGERGEGSVKNYPSVEIIGDIVISLEKAEEEAEDAGCLFYERVFALIIHGLLHVLGFDHENSKSESLKMRYREKKLLNYVQSNELYKELVLSKSAMSNEQ